VREMYAFSVAAALEKIPLDMHVSHAALCCAAVLRAVLCRDTLC
jgi:hypothetical protein